MILRASLSVVVGRAPQDDLRAAAVCESRLAPTLGPTVWFRPLRRVDDRQNSSVVMRARPITLHVTNSPLNCLEAENSQRDEDLMRYHMR